MNMKRWVWLALLCGPVLASAAELHKWVDEHGKVHYGDKVPTQHEQNAKPVEAPVNVINSDHDRKYVPPPYRAPAQSANPDNSNKPRVTRRYPDEGKNNACAREWRAYREARSCFKQCSRTIDKHRQVWYGEDCKCQNLAMPTCVP